MQSAVRTGLLLALLALTAYWSTFQLPVSADSNSRTQTAFSFLIQGNADLDEYASLPAPLAPRTAEIGGHLYAPYTTGNALVFTLPAAVWLALGQVSTSLAAVTVLPKVVASLLVAASVLLTHLGLRQLVSARPAIFITIAYALGTYAFGGASQQYSEHSTSLALVSAVLYCVLRRGPTALAVGGLLGGLAVIVRPTNVFLVVASALWLFVQQRRMAWRLLLWAIPPIAFQLSVSWIQLGSPLGTARGPVPLGSLLEGGAGLMISPSRGLLVYAPWVAVGILGLLAAWRRPADDVRDLLRYGSLAFVASWVVFGSYADWWGGWTFGDRYMSDLAPLYAMGAADLWRRGLGQRAFGRLVLAAAMGWAILLEAVGAGLYYFTWNGFHWDVTPDINATPWRVWDWGDTQWGFLLRRLVNDPGPRMILELAVVVAVVIAFALVARRSRAPQRPDRA